MLPLKLEYSYITQVEKGQCLVRRTLTYICKYLVHFISQHRALLFPIAWRELERHSESHFFQSIWLCSITNIKARAQRTRASLTERNRICPGGILIFTIFPLARALFQSVMHCPDDQQPLVV